MAPLIYLLCALTSLACSVLLWRSYATTRSRLLFWSAMCFVVLTVNNALLVLDKVILPNLDFSRWRLAAALVAVLLLLFGLVWEEE
jgi:hydrogenase/urease accessory protein HupE